MFHLWWNKNLVKHGTVSKYFETDSLKKILLLFIFLLRAKLLRKIISWREFPWSCFKKMLKQIWNSFNVKYKPHWKDRKKSYQVRQILGLFLSLNCTQLKLKKCEKNYSNHNYQRNCIWRSLQLDRIKPNFQRQYFAKYLGANLVLMWDSTQREKFSFSFSSVFF